MATSTMTMHTTTIPIRVMPRWFFMNPPSLECSEASWLAEIEPDEKGLPDDVLVRYETPHSAVRRVVAVVAHHEIMPGGHGAGHTFGIVVAIFAKRERSRERDRRRRVALEEHDVLDSVQRLDELRRVVDPDAVGKLVDQDEVPDHQCRHHRARGNFEGLDKERAQQEDDENDREEALRILDPPRFLVVLAALLGKIDRVGQRKRPRNDQQYEEYQREIHLLSTCSMARNASWGISTVPTCFMRFFPAFCFSSNFLLRLTSPP